ncbi:hypothetical protein [Methylocystis bryophila]|uniref:Uncharacterized protein n=1 Tax=Methylocystis bryophila TaxID=655015 RepID=A0A1W6N261_9HYPH|nr:hypothetical protein [Methylocystis bryophila]ARN83923.1 hypothetical protein B1812_21865 [Methylocystis bryophila]BDV41077.1 hypothetical protein DSM21852_43310 [Methylocystis bryophila]
MEVRNYGDANARALATQGGHLFIGRGGFSLHYENGWLSGYDCETVKAAAIAAGLPVIDSRKVDLGKVAELAIRGPMIVVDRPADPPPWHALSYAPLVAVAEAYARAGADVRNLLVCGAREAAA